MTYTDFLVAGLWLLLVYVLLNIADNIQRDTDLWTLEGLTVSALGSTFRVGALLLFGFKVWNVLFTYATGK